MGITYITKQLKQYTEALPDSEPAPKKTPELLRRKRGGDGQGYLRGRHANTPKPIDKQHENRYSVKANYACSTCNDTRRVPVIDVCDCDGKDKNCRLCHGTNEIRNTIPCQECKKR